LFSWLAPFLWGKVSQLPAVSVLWWFADCFWILQCCCLTLDVTHWLRRWALWTATWPVSGSDLLSTCCQPFCLSSLCLLKVHTEISSLLLPASLVRLQHLTNLCCMFFFSYLFIIQFFFFFGRAGIQSVQEALVDYTRGGCGNTVWQLVLTCGLLNVS
jgi:hypothetical protein